MSFEQMQQFIPAEPGSEADRLLGLRNTMQYFLAEKNGEDLDTFADKYGLDFKLLVEKDEAILERFAKDPEHTIEEVEKIIYH
jgi:hypothetical protein